ncbi:TPA: hypothetical protein N2902_003690 [Vibrio parahaemolyticus]|uniref:hypothetical protein n=1 Tax=Vibrio parahaemolyticus TaxID=670 RepID=UPI000B76C074|nr:hypothetical protein [Vibrio parahaemolyticus]MDF5667950.1 hypothetical protein [Vibrio parahaemolyticus]OXD33304.1 hypothetical protein CA162_13050 [Vibrio parahaemolyticus]HBH7915267.1 hypothetical protein [Vibrio parahaemolyticus]HCM1332080.1 hypothetical protein [Vibrio parahaemolyticus]
MTGLKKRNFADLAKLGNAHNDAIRFSEESLSKLLDDVKHSLLGVLGLGVNNILSLTAVEMLPIKKDIESIAPYTSFTEGVTTSRIEAKCKINLGQNDRGEKSAAIVDVVIWVSTLKFKETLEVNALIGNHVVAGNLNVKTALTLAEVIYDEAVRILTE